MKSIEDLRRVVCEQNIRLAEERLVKLTWGNVSGRSADGELIAIKPSGVRYAELTPEAIVVLDLEGHVVEGRLRPSVDTPTHLQLYRAFADIGGVVHAHSPYGTAFSQARIPVRCIGTTHADHFSGDVPVTRPLDQNEVDVDYEANTGRIIVEYIRSEGIDPLHVPAVLAAGHAPFVWGTTPAAAVDNTIALEASARMSLLSQTIVGGTPQELEGWILAKHHDRKHGTDAYYGQEEA